MKNEIIRVLVNGAEGRMGQATVNAILENKNLELVGKGGREDNLAQLISESQAQVVVDFTTPDAVFNNTMTILESNARPVVGTTGLTPLQLKELQTVSREKNLGGLIAPNFSVGAVLMMQFAREAAKYLPHVEIIEMHHDQKKDAPSGTAAKTAAMIAEVRSSIPRDPTEKEIVVGSRGAKISDIHIHAVRLPGLVAHQQVIFGGIGETLTIKHDSIDRQSFMPGVVLACQKVMGLDQIVYGLENIL